MHSIAEGSPECIRTPLGWTRAFRANSSWHATGLGGEYNRSDSQRDQLLGCTLAPPISSLSHSAVRPKAMLRPTPREFIDSIKDWFFGMLKPSPSFDLQIRTGGVPKLPFVADRVKTFRDAIAFLNTTDA